VQNSNSALASSKFREQSLQQELDLQKKNNEWLENERKIKANEHATFRKEKNVRISELTQSNEQYIAEADALRRSESGLRSRLEEQITKHEEALQETQRLREDKVADTDAFRVELDSVNRLAELQKASAETARQRVQELSNALDEVREEAAVEIGRVRAEIETEHSEKEAAEQRVSELEVKIEELEHDLEQVRVRPSTPQRGLNGNGPSTPIRAATPVGIFSPASTSRFKGGLSMTQLYTEYQKLEKALATEKKTSEQLQSNVDSMIEELESSKPEIEELRGDHTRLEIELAELSALVEQADQARDAAQKDARAYHAQLEAASKDLQSEKQLVRDLGAEVRYLLLQQLVAERGDTITRDEMRDIEAEADASAERDMEGLSEMQKHVNQKLLLFRNVAELQQINANQLTTTRNLADALQEAHSEDKKAELKKLKEDLESAQSRMGAYQDEIKSMVAQSRSYVKERDMFRSMLTRKGQLPGHVDPLDFSRSLPIPHAGSPARGLDDFSVNGGDSDYAKLLKDLQTHFDAYRQEAATDHTALKNQVNDLTKRSSQLQMEASRALGQLSAANQRSEMLQANYNMLKTEHDELKHRSSNAAENASKQELRVQHVAEELVEAKGQVDSLRRESANLKAEKDLWKTIETRLVNDQESLRNERSRLDKLNGSLQAILNEREQTDSETRRRLQAQADSLESELQSTKRKLNEEVEENKRASQRRNFEHEQNQKKIDDLVASLSFTKEELAIAKTSRDHLQAKVDELTVNLRSTEERIEVLTRPAEPAQSTSTADEDALTRQQELEVEVSELKRDLDLTTSELGRSNEQIEVYKDISLSSEERLRDLTQTNGDYREETDAALAEKDDIIKDLEQRVQDISSELSTTNSELSHLRDQQSESNRKLDQQKHAYEADIARLKEQEEKSTEQAQFNLEATKMQAQIATDAQQNYEKELVKHAEATKSLHAARAEANQLRLDVVDLRTQAETAKNNLEQKDASWSEIKGRYEREIEDLKKRREEVLQQNTLLHGQLEGLTQQITALQRDRAALHEGAQTTDNNGPGLDNLQEVIKYLRREKEIVDVQYHLSTQESKRLRQQLDFTQSQLDESRLKLEQHLRAEVDSERNAMNHNKLMETLNELNLYRESSVTLRAEAKQAAQSLDAKTKQIQELEAEIQPLKDRVAELVSVAESHEEQLKSLEGDRDGWRERTQNILSKYDRVDPAVLEEMKNKLRTLEIQRDEAETARAALQGQIDAHPGEIEAAKSDLRTRLQDQFKPRYKKATDQIKEKQAEIDAASVEKSRLQTELDDARQQLETAQRQSATAAIEAAPNEAGDHSEQVVQLEARVSELESSLAQKDKELAAVRTEQNERFKARESELQSSMDRRLQEVRDELENSKTTALDQLRQALESDHQQALETLRAQSVPVAAELQKQSDAGATAEPANTATMPAQLTDEVLASLTDEQARKLVKTNSILLAIMKSNIRKAVERESAKPAADGIPAERLHELESKFAQEKENLLQQKEHEFTTQRDALVKEHEQRLAAETQALIEQQKQSLESTKLEFSEESARKVAEQVANAQAMIEKKSSVKLNMSDTRARMAQAKLDIVKKAAEETPDKPVVEVWNIAKDAKAGPVTQLAKPAAPGAASPTKAVLQPAVSTARAPDPAATNGVAKPAEPTDTTPKEQLAETETRPLAASSTTAPAQQNAGTGPAALNQIRSSLPQVRGGSFRGGRGGHQAAGNQTQIPSATARGTGIPRGRVVSRGGGRGNGPNVQTNVPQTPGGRGGGGVSSPSRGALNPAAQQFTPGGKRAREDGEGGDGGNMGKRIRGGGGGA